MTAICGIVHNGEVWMGADSAMSNGWSQRIGALPKLFRLGSEMLVGVTGSQREIQILQYHLRVQSRPADVSDEGYLVTHLIEAIREAFKKCGHAKTEDGQEQSDLSALLGYRGHLWEIGDNYQIVCFGGTPEMAAIGVGKDFALGAMYTFRNSSAELSGQVIIEESLKAAAEFSVGVCAPFVIERL